jgi:hypothetical protein
MELIMSDTVAKIFGQIVVRVITTLINAFFIMWFWNDGLVGAVDGIHTVGYDKALLIYMLVTTFFEPLVKLSKDEK